MWSTVLTFLGWILKRWKYVLTWFGPFFARLLSKWYVIAGLTVLSFSTWAFNHYVDLFHGVAAYFNSVAEIVSGINLQTGVAWIDGFLGCFALDRLFSLTGAFLTFYIPLVGFIIFGILLSIIGFSVKMLIYKIVGSGASSITK